MSNGKYNTTRRRQQSNNNTTGMHASGKSTPTQANDLVRLDSPLVCPTPVRTGVDALDAPAPHPLCLPRSFFNDTNYFQDSITDSDDFRMYCMKVLPCSKRVAHDWTTCVFAHNGEKARRRDPRKYNYTGIACVDMKEGGSCERGDDCPVRVP